MRSDQRSNVRLQPHLHLI